MIKTQDAIRAARSLIGTPYSELDCIGLIKKIIRTAPGGVKSYTTAGTNTLWKSYHSSAKYRDLTWRQEGIAGAQAGMLVFKRKGEDVHHVGLVTDEGTVFHSSSVYGRVVETELDGSWNLLAKHRYIETAGAIDEGDEDMNELYRARVATKSGPLNLRQVPEIGKVIAQIPKGEIVKVYSVGDWPRIRWGETLGYASAAYLERIAEEPQEEGEAADMDAMAGTMTTLRREEDGAVIMLAGKWSAITD